MLKAQGVKKTFFPGSVNEKRALRGVDLTLEDGDFATVIGSNGAGKSTFLNAIAGVFPIDSGTIEVGGVDISDMPEYKRAQYIGRVYLKDAKVETLPKITHDETPMVEKSSARKDVDLMLPSEMRPEILGVLTIKPERMGISDLWQYIAHLKETKQTSDRYQVALWSKVFYPLAIFVMLAVAMPFA